MRKIALALVILGGFTLAGCSNFAPVKKSAEPGCASAKSACAASCSAAAEAKKACGDDCAKACCDK